MVKILLALFLFLATSAYGVSAVQSKPVGTVADPRESALPAASPSRGEARRHFALLNPAGELQCEATEVVSNTPKADRRTYLLRCDEDEYHLSSEFNYDTHVFSREVRPGKGDDFLRVYYKQRGSFNTRAELSALLAANPSLRDADVLVVAETNGASYAAKTSAWKADPEARSWRHDLRLGMRSPFLESVENLSNFDVGGEAELRAAIDVSSYILSRPACPAVEGVHVVPKRGDCDFDRAMGYPCTEKQRERADAAANPYQY